MFNNLKKLLLVFFIILKPLSLKADTFNSFNEISKCVDNFYSIYEFRDKFQKCYFKKNIVINNNAISIIVEKNNVLNKLIEKNINKLLEANVSTNDIFSKPSAFSTEYYLDEETIDIIINYSSKNPTLVYGIIKDINNLTFEDQFISSNQREKTLLRIYNSFDFELLIKNSKKFETVKIVEKKPKIIEIKKSQKKIEKKESLVKTSKPTLLEKLKELTKKDKTKDKEKKLPKKEKSKVLLPKKEKVKTAKTNPGMFALIPLLALAGGGGGGGGGAGTSTTSSPPTLSYSTSTTLTSECDSGLTFTGTLTSSHTSNVTVSVTTSGTATAGVDYILSSSTLTITAGSTTGSVTVTPVNDTLDETSETIILSTSVTGGGLSTTGSTSSTISLHDYVLKCNATAYSEGTTSEQNTIKSKTQWTFVEPSGSGRIHPYEQMNVHKAQSFTSGTTTLTGVNQVIHIADHNCDDNHDIYKNKTVTHLDDGGAGESDDDSADATDHHCQSVAGFAIGDATGSAGAGESKLMGVAHDADVVLSSTRLCQGSFCGDDFGSDLDAAAAASAIVSNNSWGIGDSSHTHGLLNVTEFAALMSANGRTATEQFAASFHSSTSSQSITEINEYLTALNNFEKTGVVVFAAGNQPLESDASLMAGLPEYFSDLGEAWISANVVEYTGDADLSDAVVSEFTLRGHKCGSTKEYCLSVDAWDMDSATWVDSGTSKYDTDASSISFGSSFSAPMISGGIALLTQAFPNHTPEQLTDRLLASANNVWFSPEGNTTFTTHGASIKHGYHSTWGHGIPDFYKALSPLTTNSNPASFVVNSSSLQSSYSGTVGKIIPISSTSLTQSSSIGDAISKGLKDKNTYFYDALAGGFKFDLSNLITKTSLNKQKIKTDFNKELNILRNLDIDKNQISLEQKNYKGEYFNFRNETDQGLSFTLSEPNIALQNFNINNNKYYNNPFTSYTSGLGLNNKFNLFNNDILLGYHNSYIDPLKNKSKERVIPVENFSLSMNIDNNNFDILSITTGLLKEKNTFLLSQGYGALTMNDSNSISNYYGLNFSKNLNNYGNIYFSSMMGFSELNNLNNSFIVDTSDVLTSNFEINYELENLIDNDKLDISLSQPNRVEKGDMTFRLTGLADSNGNLPYHDHNIDLVPTGRQIDLSIGYYTKHSKNLKTGVKTILTDDLGHIRGNNLDSNILFLASYNF